MYTTIIDRYEQKYYLTNSQFDKLIKELGKRLVKDKYFKETIYNIYFDNDNYELINRSIDKPIYKEKVRARSYVIPNDDTDIFLEIKKKYKANGNKRRVVIKYRDLINYIDKGIVPNCDKQIMKEIDYCFKYYGLLPKVRLWYDRLAYYLDSDNNFRITFDSNVRYSDKDVRLGNIDNYKVSFKEGYIMEVKTLKGVPMWLNDILMDLNILPISYSKVGNIFGKESNIYV